MRLSRSASIRGDVHGLEALRDMLRTVCVPGRDGEEERLFWPRPIARRHQPGDQTRIVFDDARFSANLDASPVSVIDQKEIGLRIVGQIAKRDVLAVAGEIGKADRPVVEHLEKAAWPTAMLDIGLAVAADHPEENADLAFDEF